MTYMSNIRQGRYLISGEVQCIIKSHVYICNEKNYIQYHEVLASDQYQ